MGPLMHCKLGLAKGPPHISMETLHIVFDGPLAVVKRNIGIGKGANPWFNQCIAHRDRWGLGGALVPTSTAI